MKTLVVDHVSLHAVNFALIVMQVKGRFLRFKEIKRTQGGKSS